MENLGDISCSVKKWRSLVVRFSAKQRSRIEKTILSCMLNMSSIKMHMNLIKFMIEVYDPATKRFVIQDSKDGTISARGVDVECLFGLRDKGLCVQDILVEEGSEAKAHIPPSFVSKKTGNLVIQELIDDIISNPDIVDDDFVRKV